MFRSSARCWPTAEGDLGRRRLPSHQRQERHAPRVVEFGGLPVHPLFDTRPLRRHHRQQVGALHASGQIATDGVRLPQHDVTIHDHRDGGVGIQRQVRRFLGRTESLAPRFGRVDQFQLVAEPEHLAHIDRRRLAEILSIRILGQRGEDALRAAPEWPRYLSASRGASVAAQAVSVGGSGCVRPAAVAEARGISEVPVPQPLKRQR